MKKAILLTFILTVLCVFNAYAQKLEEPEKTYTQEEIAQRLLEGDEVAFTDIFFAEKDDMPMAASLDNVNSVKYYDQLTAPEKEIYEYLSNNADSTKDGVTALTIAVSPIATSEIVLPDQNKAEYLRAKIEEAVGVSVDTLFTRPVYVYFYLDHPEKFWLDLNKINYAISYRYSKYSITPSLTISLKSPNTNYWQSCYTSQEQVNADIQAVNERTDEIISALPENASDFYKLKYFIEWLCSHNTYNPSISTGSRYMYIAPSALLYGSGTDTKKYPVCEGYSEALKILCDKAGIETMCIESETHKWNAVKLGDSFYHTDPTWCDTYTGIRRYRFMLAGAKQTTAMDTYDSGKQAWNHAIFLHTAVEPPVFSQNMYIGDMGFPVDSAQNYYYRNIDINSSGNIDFDDSLELLKQAAGIRTKTAKDMNSDGSIDLLDAIKLNSLLFK